MATDGQDYRLTRSRFAADSSLDLELQFCLRSTSSTAQDRRAVQRVTCRDLGRDPLADVRSGGSGLPWGRFGGREDSERRHVLSLALSLCTSPGV